MKKEHLEKLLEAVKNNMIYCPWVKEQDIETYKEEIMSEAKEISKAISEKDYENLKEELGDLLWDTLAMILIAERDGYFKAKDVINSIIKKMKARKPHIFEEKHVTKEEAARVWKKGKAKQGEKR